MHTSTSWCFRIFCLYHHIDGTRTELWSKSGDSGDEWYQAVVTFTPHLSYHLLFEGEVGSDHSSDAALDDIEICLNNIQPGKNIIKNLVRALFLHRATGTPVLDFCLGFQSHGGITRFPD